LILVELQILVAVVRLAYGWENAGAETVSRQFAEMD
jgi:hypothetical protein